MVYCFMIHSVDKDSEVVVYISHFFTRKGNDGQKIARQTALIKKVQEDLSISQSYSGMKTPKGNFSIPGATKFFKTPKIVLWRKIQK